MTDDGKAAADEAAREAERVGTARAVSMVSAIVSAAITAVLLICDKARDIAILQPLLALSIATALMLGARALDGPIRLQARRRDSSSTSAAAASVLLWLGCFGAIEAAFLIVDVVDRLEARTSCPAGASNRFKGVLTVAASGAQRALAVTGCRIDGNAADGSSFMRNAQDVQGVGVVGNGVQQ